jgi:membrane glycosyltransferase
MLSIPISMFTSREKAGLWFKKHHYFLIPEETKIPHIIRAAKKYKEALVKTKEKSYGADLIIRDSVLNALHILMLPIKRTNDRTLCERSFADFTYIRPYDFHRCITQSFCMMP